MRILSGMRPTGRLHLGNLLGALRNWVELQEGHDGYFMVADWHMLTTDYHQTGPLREAVREMVLDFLAAGLDPGKSVIFLQSHVKAHAELYLLLSMIVPLSWLERNPSYKEQLRELKTREIRTHGFLGYPVLQAADILVYRGEGVPVGEDQEAHLELTREIARRFNHLYENVFPEPKTLKSPTPKIPGLDARKMSKSYGNTIDLGDRGEALKQKVMAMFTDPKKIRKDDPGNPDGCVVYAFHAVYTKEDAPQIEQDCRAGKIGCVACKKNLLDHMAPALEPLWTRRDALKKEDVDGLLEEGCQKARIEAEKTLHLVRRAMKLP